MSLRDRLAPGYEASFGFVPASVDRRIALWERVDPENTELFGTTER
jgi:hypothetical protein